MYVLMPNNLCLRKCTYMVGFGYGTVRGGLGNEMSGLKKSTSLSTSKQNSSMSQISEAAASGNSPEESGSFGAFRGNNNYSAWEINSSLQLQVPNLFYVLAT